MTLALSSLLVNFTGRGNSTQLTKNKQERPREQVASINGHPQKRMARPCSRNVVRSRRKLEIMFLLFMTLAPLLHFGSLGGTQLQLHLLASKYPSLTTSAEASHQNHQGSFRNTLKPDAKSRTNRTLVILMGDLRCGEPCWKSLQEHVLHPNQADLALLIQPPKPQYQNASLFNIAKYHWPIPHYNNWLDALDIIMDNSSDWQQYFFDTLSPFYQDSIVLGPIQYQFNDTTTLQFSGSAVIIFYMRYLLSQRIQQLYLTHHYEWFIVTRTDQYYWCTHDITPFQNDPEHVWIPRGEDYGGITDRHLVVHRKHVLKALNILPPLLHNPQRYRPFFQQQKHQNSEMFIKLRLEEEGLLVKRFPRTMFLAGVPGDSYLWRPAWKPLKKAGVNVKYHKEYTNTKRNCLAMRGRHKLSNATVLNESKSMDLS